MRLALEAWRALGFGLALPAGVSVALHPDMSLVPYDEDEIVTGSAEVEAFLARRESRWHVSDLTWHLVAFWSLGANQILIVARQDMHSVVGKDRATRHHVVVFIASIDDEGRMNVRHVTEAAPAFLPLAIAQYHDAAAEEAAS